MKTRASILLQIEAFLTSSGETERQFGIDVVGDHKFVRRLRGGHGVTLTSIEKAEAYIADYPASKLLAEQARAARASVDVGPHGVAA
jgi:hypothetical protein